MSTFELINTGILMGIIHVLTGPDHLSALATLSGTNLSSGDDGVGYGGGRRLESFLLGIKWGVGHSLGLLVVGGLLIATEESSSEWISMDTWWSVVLEGFVGVFMLALGCYGLHKAFRNRESSVLSSLPLGRGDSHMAVEVVEMRPGSRDSITKMMEETLEHDSEHGSQSEALRRVSEQSNEDDIDASIRDAASKTSGGLSDSFIKYKARNRPKLKKATSMVKRHAAPEKSIIVSLPNERKVFGQYPSSFTAPSILALLAGIVHGVAGPGGVLGVIPAVQLKDAGLASLYLGTFCVTSTLAMGAFAAFYGTFSEWLASGRQPGEPKGNRVFLVEAGSASLSVVVGIIWLVLVSMGKMEELFP